MLETQKSRIDTMTRQELQNILLDRNLYDADIIDYVTYRLRCMPTQSSFAESETIKSMPFKVSFSSAYKAFFRNYANFKGRSSRSEFWFVSLANFLIALAVYLLLIPDIILMALGEGDSTSLMIRTLVILAVYFIYQLVCFVPSLSLSVRRLHDIDKSGWCILLGLIPIVGGIVLFVFSLTDSDYENNQYGKNPKVYPDKLHKNRSKTVLIVFLSILAIVSVATIYRVVAFVSAYNDAVMNGWNITDLDGMDDTDDWEDWDGLDAWNGEYDPTESTGTYDLYDDESSFSYEFFPTDAMYITYSDLLQMSRTEVAFTRNEIYARHGYIFESEPYKSYFNSCSWYVPNVNFNENLLSDIEKTNKDTIVAYEREMGWR